MAWLGDDVIVCVDSAVLCGLVVLVLVVVVELVVVGVVGVVKVVGVVEVVKVVEIVGVIKVGGIVELEVVVRLTSLGVVVGKVVLGKVRVLEIESVSRDDTAIVAVPSGVEDSHLHSEHDLKEIKLAYLAQCRSRWPRRGVT